MPSDTERARQHVVDALRAYKERLAAYDAGLAAWAFGPTVDLWNALVNTRTEVDERKRELDQKIEAFKLLLDVERGV